MQIIYANAFYSPNSSTGGNAHIYQFIRNAAGLGHTIWTYEPDAHPDARRLPTQRLARLMCLGQADAYYVRVGTQVPPVAHWAVPPRRLLLGRRTPVVWEFNALPATDGKTVSAFRRFGRGVDLAVCVSKPLAEYVESELGFRRALVVPNGSDPEMFRPDVTPVQRIAKDCQHLNVVWIGSANIAYDDWYDFDLLRDAATILWNSPDRDTVQFHMIGPGQGLIRSMPPNVHYHGAEDYRMMPHWLAAMDVGLLLYKYREGTTRYISPLKLFDYMASGLAVVGVPLPQVEEVFRELEEPDLLVPWNEAESLVRILLRLHRDRDRLARCGQKGRQLVIDKYNWLRAVKDTLQAIEELIHTRN